jgi:hypothetical protein
MGWSRVRAARLSAVRHGKRTSDQFQQVCWGLAHAADTAEPPARARINDQGVRVAAAAEC